MKTIKFSVVLIASLMANTAFAAQDLMQTFTQSLQSDPQILAEAASRAAVSEQEKQALANFLPQVALNASKGKTWQDTSSSNLIAGKRQYNTRGYSLNITQPLYRKNNFVLQNQADLAIESASASYQIAEQTLVVRVADSYFEFLARQDDVTFAVAEFDAIAKQLEQTKQRFDVGLDTITDVSEAQAAYDLANANVITAENNLANSKERLREITGTEPESLAELMNDTPLVSPEPASIDEWAALALEQNPNISLANLAVENASENIQLQKSGHYPTLDLVGQKSYNSQSDSSFGGATKTDQDTISLELNIPIYSGGSVVSKTREASHRLDEAMQNQEQQRRAVMRQSREAYNGVMSGISRVKALKQAVMSNQQALESTEAGYEVGTRTTVDVLNVRRDLFKAKRDYASSRYEYILSSLRLKQAAGVISVNDLADINQWLQ